MNAISVPGKAAKKAGELVDQGAFDFLMPYSERRQLLSVSEVAKVLERSIDFVEGMIQEGRLEALAPQNREKQRKRVTRRSVLLLLAEQSLELGGPILFTERLLRCLDVCTAEQLGAVIVRASQRRAKL